MDLEIRKVEIQHLVSQYEKLESELNKKLKTIISYGGKWDEGVKQWDGIFMSVDETAETFPVAARLLQGAITFKKDTLKLGEEISYLSLKIKRTVEECIRIRVNHRAEKKISNEQLKVLHHIIASALPTLSSEADEYLQKTQEIDKRFQLMDGEVTTIKLPKPKNKISHESNQKRNPDADGSI